LLHARIQSGAASGKNFEEICARADPSALGGLRRLFSAGNNFRRVNRSLLRSVFGLGDCCRQTSAEFAFGGFDLTRGGLLLSASAFDVRAIN
jgi:hypothetical protein